MPAADPAAPPEPPRAFAHRRGFDALFGVAGEGAPRTLARLLVILALGAAVGAGARFIRMPLPFVLGPLIATAGLGIADWPVIGVRRLRPGAQFVIGSAIGIQFTHAIVMRLVLLLPVIISTAILAIAVCAAASAFLIVAAGLDRKTAFFATSPAGASEMANIAARYGGEPEPIMVAQTIRVIMTVMAAPFLVIHFANDGQAHQVQQAAVLAWPALVSLVPVAALGGFLLSRTAFPNGWFMGPLIACALVGITGLIEGRVPDLLLTVAQVVTGCSLGAQFRREFITKLARMVAVSALSIVLVLVVMAAAAIGLGLALHLPIAALALALAPAGMAEMTLTGKVLGLDAALISGFHAVRIIMVMGLVVPVFRIFDRLMSRLGVA
ncbi:MAG TPA: AbrB family transcriptional regulator [Xanthobacteraceae bacterium]|nr:AbrB family transcriptional regulator [Xanthobacteraceae bacterium]